MDIARGPEPTALDAAPAERTLTPEPAREPAAIAALPQAEREGFTSMNANIDAQLARVRDGADVPPALAGALGSQAQVYESLGLEPPQSYANVRARLTAQPENAQTEGVQLESAQPARDPRDVARAVATIREALVDQIGPQSDVSNANLHLIQRTIYDLSPADATAAVAQLRDDEVAKWASEVNEGSVRGRGAGFARDGYSLAEKTALLETLATHLDAAQMIRFTAALTDGLEGSEGYLAGRAVSEHAPPAVQRTFVRAGARSDNPEVGVAAGEVLAGLRGASLDRTLESLQADGTIDSFVGGAVRETMDGRSGHVIVSYDADTLGRVLRTSAGSGSALARASLVDSAARKLAEVEGAGGFNVTAMPGDSVAQIRDGITSIAERDPVAVVQALENDVAPFGGDFPRYLASMIGSGQSGRVGAMLANIGTGNGVAGSSAEWVTQRTVNDGTESYYENAVTLGFAVGSVRRAIESLSDSARERGEMIKDVFGTAAGAAGVANAPAGVAASVLTGMTGLAVDVTVDRAVARNTAIEQTLFELSFPRNADGSLYNGPAEIAFASKFASVAVASP